MKTLEFRAPSLGDRASHQSPARVWDAQLATQGRDARLPEWTRRPEGQPSYDSVVIRGTGIGATTLAVRLARSEEFAGRVVLAGPRTQPSPRLVGGCTLRARALDYVALALGRPRQALIDELYGSEATARRAATFRQVALVARDAGSQATLGRQGTWSRSARESPLDAVAFGIRNGNLKSLLDRAVPTTSASRELTRCPSRTQSAGSLPLAPNP